MAQTSSHTMRFGAACKDGTTRFRLFAPAFTDGSRPILLELEGRDEPLSLRALGDGWHELITTSATAGARYRFRLPTGMSVADPASRFQPEDAEGPSEVIDPETYVWRDAAWRGRPWAEAVLYELHVGTFTAEGTFRAAAAKLCTLAETGITAIELMCLTDFPGTRSWGYDGVLLFAPDSAYGRPEDLKAFVDEAHGHGILVILDVVFNHFGPEGNYLPTYFPETFSQEHKTAWGPGLNFDGPGCGEVRELIVENALYWLEEFHADGLRLDASHAMLDGSAKHILDELVERVRAFAAGQTPPRRVHLILENEDTIGRRLTRNRQAEAVAYTAQWNHAVDHLLGAALGGGCSAHDPANTHEIDEIGKALAEGFVAGALNCQPPDSDLRVPPTAFVSFLQTHDLVGNRPFGDRVHALAAPTAVRVVAAIYLLAPQIPMIFMGEEWAASTPFPYFCDFHGGLAEAVRLGRCADMAKSGQLSEDELKRVPDPGALATFQSAKLRWEEVATEPHRSQLAWYRRVLQARREYVIPSLQTLAQACGHHKVFGPATVMVTWTLGGNAVLEMAAHLFPSISPAMPAAAGEVFWLEGSEQAAENGEVCLGPWSVRWVVKRG